MSGNNGIPRMILVLFLIEGGLCAAYALNFWIGGPSVQVTRLFNLGGEANLPTWFSSMQWFCVSYLFGIFAVRNLDRSRKDTWLLLLFPVLFLIFSIDEFVQIHEWLGTKTDIFLPGGARKNTFFHATGIWMFLVGIPVLAGCLWVLSSLKKYFIEVPAAYRKFTVGILVFFGGAIGVETLSNLSDGYTWSHILENILEEGMEMVGVTIMLWGTYDLLVAHGFSWNPYPMEENRNGDINPHRDVVRSVPRSASIP